MLAILIDEAGALCPFNGFYSAHMLARSRECHQTLLRASSCLSDLEEDHAARIEEILDSGLRNASPSSLAFAFSLGASVTVSDFVDMALGFVVSNDASKNNETSVNNSNNSVSVNINRTDNNRRYSYSSFTAPRKIPPKRTSPSLERLITCTGMFIDVGLDPTSMLSALVENWISPTEFLCLSRTQMLNEMADNGYALPALAAYLVFDRSVRVEDIESDDVGRCVRVLLSVD